ncbi:MAG: hypothetical protein A4E49_01374 [Methanosaeta sp. PtaU1.Bin112]|nr:MAG: hypothetical protein A4E49_01374 [Methanosaeta sp. PtaU1.Bin112]
MTILVGCSGWSYDDWVGKFYPLSMAGKKGEWFSYYAGYFQTVEINSTFYRPPGELQVQSWIKKAKDLKGFEYSVKVPQLVTHKALVDGDVERAVFWAASFEKTCIKPLAEAGLLGGVLLQLSPYFRNDSSALASINGLLDCISHREYDYAVEFRHRSWLDEGAREIAPEALDALSERNVANVLIDGPGLHAGNEQTADHAYVRFHGRNYDIWYRGEDKAETEDDHRLDRYDYLYNKEQLEAWVPRIKAAELKADKMRVYFNNHARSKSVRNAFLLMDMLSIEHKSKEIRLQDQFTLGEFQ